MTPKHFLFLLLAFLSTRAFAQTQGDALRAETRLDQVYQQYNLDGSGTIVAMIERGIDYTHPDFVDADGKTRIAYIYDMINPAGANDPGNPYGVGTIFTRDQIDQALSSGTLLGSTDRFGHGTACTGIAAGDGSAMVGAPYRGAAPGAAIISVKVTHDYFPATGNIAGQAGFYNPAFLPIALQFVKDKSIELGLPVVALLNLGSIGGPTDGSSEISRAMEEFAGEGRVLICGVGDDGGAANRAADTLAQGGTSELQFRKGQAGNLRLEIWYSGDDRFGVSIVRPTGPATGALPTPATNQTSSVQGTPGITYYHRGSDQDFANADNGQRQIMVDFNGDTGVYKVFLAGNTIVDGSYFASLNPSNFYSNNAFLNHLYEGASINDFASAHNILAPTDYVFDYTYVDLDGIPRSRSGQGAQGDLWIGSSEGPTLDGRLGVDIAVPGELSIGAYSPDTYYSQFRFNMMQGSNGYYGLQNAVSGAAPTLVGVVALMLQVNPALSTEQIRTILHQTARSDAFTGATPNPSWGYGKLDAFAAVQATYATLSIENSSLEELGFSVYPNPSDGKLSYAWQGSSPGYLLKLEILDLSGKLLSSVYLNQSSGELAYDRLPRGVYLLRVTDEARNRQGISKLVLN
ncbi:MAG: S8 family peptidase [Bacteroidia bacterium]|nr:S8 family peptidase [Bacteroidia bacterium]